MKHSTEYLLWHKQTYHQITKLDTLDNSTTGT